MISDLVKLISKAEAIARSQPVIVNLYENDIIIYGDIHGYFEAIESIRHYIKLGKTVVILGDYSGYFDYCKNKSVPKTDSVMTLNKLLRLYVDNPGRLILLRGNHEDACVHSHPLDRLYPDLKKRAKSREEAMDILLRLERFFSQLPLAVKAMDAIMLHGGIPINKPDEFLDELKSYGKPGRIIEPPFHEIVRNRPINRPEGRQYGYTFSCMNKRRPVYAYGHREMLKMAEAYEIKKIIVGHLHPKIGSYKVTVPDTDIMTLSLCSSYPTCKSRKAKYARLKTGGKLLVYSLF